MAALYLRSLELTPFVKESCTFLSISDFLDIFHIKTLKMGRGDYRNYYKGHMDKIKGESGGGGGRWVQLGWGGGWGEKAYNCN